MRDITPDVTEIVSPPIGKPTHLGCFHWHRPSATDVAEKNVDQLPVLSRLKTSSSRWGSFWLSLTCWRPSQNLIGSIKRLMGQIHDGFEKPFWLKKSAELSHYFHHVSCWVLQIPTFPFRPLFWLSCSSFSTVRTAASHSQPTERTFAKCFTSEPRRCAFTFANQLGSNLLGNPSGNLGNLLKFLNYSDFCENHDMVWRVPKPLDIFATFPNGNGCVFNSSASPVRAIQHNGHWWWARDAPHRCKSRILEWCFWKAWERIGKQQSKSETLGN